MISAYVRNLNRSLESERPAPQPLSLRDRFLTWYRSMPGFTRSRPFSMSEFEAALKTQGKYISPVLLELGGQRKRIWNTGGHYHRYWVPPALSEEPA